MTTPLDADWNTLPLSNFYLPFVQSAVRYLAGGAVIRGNLAPGDLIKMTLDDVVPSENFTLIRPDGRTVKLDAVHLEKQAELRYADTEQPGIYRVQAQESAKPAETTFFIVHPPREESILTQLDEEKWQWLERSLGFTRIDPTERPVLETLGAHREGRELWGLLMLAVFTLAVMEMLVARIGSVQTNPVAQSNAARMDEGPTAGEG